jgi:hypothetical protein
MRSGGSFAVSLIFTLLLLESITSAIQRPLESRPGLAVIAEPARASVRPGDPIVIRLTFRNTSDAAFRLPDQIAPAPYPSWFLKVQDVTTGKSFTGVSTRPLGAAPEPGEINPQVMQPGGVKTITVAFSEFAFVEGDLGFQEARNIWFPQRLNAPPTLAAGTYDIRAGIRFRSFPVRPNLPPEIVEAQRALEAGSIPLWSGGNEVYSSPARVEVKADAIVRESESIQIAKDAALSLLDFLSAYQQDLDFSRLERFAGLRNDLRVVSAAVSSLRNNDGTDADLARTQVRALRDAVTQASTRAAEISVRSNESPPDKAKARWLYSQLLGFVSPLVEAAR